MNKLEIENGFLCLNGKKYSELNWLEMFKYNQELLYLRIKNRIENEKTTLASGKTEV